MNKGRTPLVVGLLVKVLELCGVCVRPGRSGTWLFPGARTEVGALPDIQNDWSMRRSSGSFLLNLGNNADAQGADAVRSARAWGAGWLAICGPRLTSLHQVLVLVQEHDHV